MRRRGAIAAALGALVLPRAVAAQTQQELATRRVLIERATAARAAGRHAEALALAQRAGAVRMTPSVRLFIAQQLSATGDPAGALGFASECVREVERDPAVPHRAAILATCRELVDALPARVGYLIVRGPDPAPEGLRVTVQGAALNPALLGVPHVVSPGSISIEASAPGRLPFATTRDVPRGATVEATLALPPEPAPPAAIPPPPPVVVAPPAVAAPAPVPTPAPAPRSRLAPGLLVGGGAAAILGGAALFVVRAVALGRCTVNGDAVVCNTVEDLDAARGANGLAAGGGALLGVGAAAVGVGVAWLLASPRARVTASVAPLGDGVAFGLAGRLP